MVAICGCHDPAVFGHGWACERELGPAVAGGTSPAEHMCPASHIQRYGPDIPPDRSEPWHVRMGKAMDNYLRSYSELMRHSLGPPL
jgi:hypothetical protein